MVELKIFQINKRSLFTALWCLALIACKGNLNEEKEVSTPEIYPELQRLVNEAESMKNLAPITVTAHQSDRSAGGLHDFYSEGDYWWPNPYEPNEPHIRSNGISNRDNFNAHRETMMRFSQIAGILATAFQLTREKTFIEQLKPHMLSWFVDIDTKMDPESLYWQAIKALSTSRAIGIIDIVDLIDVARALKLMKQEHLFNENEYSQISSCFTDYLTTCIVT